MLFILQHFSALVTPFPKTFFIKGNANNNKITPFCYFLFTVIEYINEEATGCVNEEAIGAIKEADMIFNIHNHNLTIMQ